MKVEVLQAGEVKIKPWRWWSDWIDVACFDHVGVGHLLQMKVSRTNSKQFTARAMTARSWISGAYIGAGLAGDLTHMTGEGR